jgi:hypothetical protein
MINNSVRGPQGAWRVAADRSDRHPSIGAALLRRLRDGGANLDETGHSAGRLLAWRAQGTAGLHVCADA